MQVEAVSNPEGSALTSATEGSATALRLTLRTGARVAAELGPRRVEDEVEAATRQPSRR